MEIIQREIRLLNLSIEKRLPQVYIRADGESFIELVDVSVPFSDIITQLGDGMTVTGETVNMRDLYVIWATKRGMDMTTMVAQAPFQVTSQQKLANVRERVFAVINKTWQYREVINIRDRIQRLELWLNDGPRVQVYDPIVTERTIAFSTPYESVTLFDKTVVSEDVPFVITDINGVPHAKLFDSGKIPYIHQWYSDRKKELYGDVNIKVLVKRTSDSYKPTDFARAYLDEARHRLYVTIAMMKKTAPVEEVIRRIRSAIPNLERIGGREGTLRATFHIVGAHFNSVLVATMIMRDTLLKYFFYVDERQSILARKEKLTLHVTIGSLRAVLSIKNVLSGKADVFSVRGRKSLINENTSLLQVKVTKVRSLEEIQSVQRIVIRLLQYYNERARVYEKLYDTFGLTTKFVPWNGSAVTQGTLGDKDSKLEMLKIADPTLFVKGYASHCQRLSQPIPISIDDVEEYRSRGFQVLKYPTKIVNEGYEQPPHNVPDYEPQYYVSADENAKYIGLKPNPIEENRDLHPYLICTYDTQYIEVLPDWSVRILQFPKRSDDATTDAFLGSGKLLPAGRSGNLTPELASLFGSGRRIGVMASSMSIIHAIAYALGDEYNADLIERKYRDMILGSVNFLIAKQEMYDLTEEEMRREFASPDTFISFSRHYRILEEYFGVHIFSFTNNGSGVEIPRFLHRYEKFTPTPDRPIIFVYRNTKQRQGVHTDPIVQYELIQLDSNEDRIPLLSDLIQRFYGSTRYEFQNNRLIAAPFIMSSLPHFEGWNIVGQYIDAAGKVRVITLEHSDQGDMISLITHGLAPFNVEVMYPVPPTAEALALFGRDTMFNHEGRTYVIYNIPSIPESTLIARKTSSVIKFIISNIQAMVNDYDETMTFTVLVDNHVYDGDEVMNFGSVHPVFTDPDNAILYYANLLPSFFTAEAAPRLILRSSQLQEGVRLYVRNFRHRISETVPEYYLYTSDFIQHSARQIVVKTVSEIERIVQVLRRERFVTQMIIYREEPYLFTHRNTPYIVQTSDSYEKAINITRMWTEEGVNPGNNPPITVEDYDVVLIDVLPPSTLPRNTIVKLGTRFASLLPLQ